MDWELLSFVKASRQRIKILKTFHSGHTPSELSQKTNLSPSHISRTLKEFCEKGLIKSENPKAHMGKIYVLTEKGQEIQEILEGGAIADKYSKDNNE